MAGFSEDDIRKVREANDIVSVFGDRVPLRQKGRTFWCCCPFHEEKSPSCQVDPNTQLWHCFGCGEGGDVFSYVMKSEDISFPDAVRQLADRANIELVETGKSAIPRGQKARLKEVCKLTADFYHLQLMRTKGAEVDAARTYLSARGLGGEVPKRWHLGFAPGRKQLVTYLQQKGFSGKEMVDANVATNYEGRGLQDRFYNRIMFPIFDETGDCIAFGGRVVGKGEPKYLNSQETPLFHKGSVMYGMDKAKAAMASLGCAVVVEGYTDVIACHEAGLSNVVATLGTALTPAHVRLLSRHAKHRIVYLFDGDAAGQRAADRALAFIDSSMTPEAGRNRIEICACTLPDNLDPADFIAQRGLEDLKTYLDTAPALIKYGIDRRIEAYDTKTAEGRAKAFAEALAVLAPIKDSLLAKEYAVGIASRLQVRENDALDALARLEHRSGATESTAAAPETAEQSAAHVEEPIRLSPDEVNRRRFEGEFIGLCARSPEIAHEQAEKLVAVNWHTENHAQAAACVLECFSQNPTASAADVVGKVLRQVPNCSSYLADKPGDSRPPAVLARYLAEELSIGDAEAEIQNYKAQLKNPQSLSAQDYDLVFQAVTALQKELAERRAAHSRA